MYSKTARNKYIKTKYTKAPEHLKGRTVEKLSKETELTKRQIYNIVKQK